MLAICSGGFLLDAEFSPQRLSELAKMDGAIILAADASRIARANVHLVPNPNVPTSETGTRHRTAERVARSIDVPGDLGVGGHVGRSPSTTATIKHPLEPIPRLLNRANQALQTLERYKNRLDAVSGSLSALEVEDLVTVRDVVTVLQRTEMVRRIAEEIDGYIVELGTDGRLVRLQLEELHGRRRGRPPPGDQGLLPRRRRLAPRPRPWSGLADLTTEDLLDLKSVTAVLHLPGDAAELDAGAAAQGLPAAAPRSPACPRRSSSASSSASAPCRRSCGPPSTTSTRSRAWARRRARAIKEGLSRLAETQHPRPLRVTDPTTDERRQLVYRPVSWHSGVGPHQLFPPWEPYALRCR